MKAHRIGKVGLEEVVVPRRQSLHDFGQRLSHPVVEILFSPVRMCYDLGVSMAVSNARVNFNP